MPITGYSSGCLASVSPYDPAVNDWISAVVVAGGTVTTARAILINNLVLGLKADGLFTKLDVLFLFAAENSVQAIIDIITPHGASPINSPIFTVNRGFTFDASTNYINTVVNPSDPGSVFSANSAHVSAYVEAVNPTATGILECMIGAKFQNSETNLQGQSNVSNVSYTVNNIITPVTVTGVLSAGMFIATRTVSTTEVLYKNGSQIDSSVIASDNAVPSNSFFVGAINSGGTALGFSPNQIAAVSIGGGLSPTDAANLTTRINTYMTAIGAQVF